MSKKSQIIVVILIGLTLITLNFNNATASDDDLDDIDDEFEDLNKRNITFEIEANQIQIESSLRRGDQIDEIQMKIVHDIDGLVIEVSYESDIDMINTTELEFTVNFRKLIEFVDLDNDSIYNPLYDDIIRQINLTTFQPVIYTNLSINDDTYLHYFIVKTTDGIFTAHIYFSEEFHIVNGSLITPIQTKFDIEISNFPYINTSSQIALYTSLESEFEYEAEEDTEDEIKEYSDNERGVITKMNNYTGLFTWKNNATIDGISKEVFNSDLAIDDYDEEEQKVYLSYSRGTNIHHDPKVGIAGIYKIIIIPDNPIFLIILITAIISSLSISIGFSIYHYRERIFEGHYTELEIKKGTRGIFGVVKYDSEKLDSLFDNETILNQLKNLPFDTKSGINDIKLTALSKEFYKVINIFDWEEEDLTEFIQEMISLTPEERKAVFKEIISKSEQQTKNRLDDSKGLYI